MGIYFNKKPKIYQGLTIRWKVRALESFLVQIDNQSLFFITLRMLIKLIRGDFKLDPSVAIYSIINRDQDTCGIAFINKVNQKPVILLDNRKSSTVMTNFKELYPNMQISELKYIHIYNLVYKLKEPKKYDFDQDLLNTDKWPSSPESFTECNISQIKEWKEYYIFTMISPNSVSICPYLKFDKPNWKIHMGGIGNFINILVRKVIFYWFNLLIYLFLKL